MNNCQCDSILDHIPDSLAKGFVFGAAAIIAFCILIAIKKVFKEGRE